MCNKVTCKECGKVEELKWIEEMNEELIKNQLCFTCNHWYEHYQRSIDPKSPMEDSIRIDGNHYVACDEFSSGGMRGFGGRKFVIEFFNGYVIRSSNLWCQGEITEVWRSRLPDNARFI